MPERALSCLRAAFAGRAFQNLAIVFCVLCAVAITVNVELAGNPMWFWYATLFHQGAKLYSDLHCALQPLFILEMNAWMQVFGVKVIAVAMLSVVHAFVLCVGLQLLLRESDWPDWQKALVLAGTFLICSHFSAYLFGDFHVVSDIFFVYSLVLLLALAKAEAAPQQTALAVALGVLTGWAVTNRVTDGAALLAGAGICIPVLARRRRLALTAVFVAVAVLAVVVVIASTGDTFHDWIANSILRAAGSKGGQASLLADPFVMVGNAAGALRWARKWLLVWLGAMVLAGAVAQRYAKRRGEREAGFTMLAEFGVAGIGFAIASPALRGQLLSGTLIDELSIVSVVVIYLLVPVVAVRFLIARGRRGRRVWDAREMLVLPLFFWLAAGSASSGGSPHNFFEMLALLLLLVAVIQPFRASAGYANATLVVLMVLLAVPALRVKILEPYAWQNSHSSPMFQNRQWVRHPVYGPMYVDRDLLHFIEPVCAEIGQNKARQELLPFPYPNYFCAVPPWHGYVQTFFDTSTRASVLALMEELQTSPPQWIVYQRQLKVLATHEEMYNHGQPLAQRDLDTLIVQKMASGEWQLVDKKDYLVGDGWWIIRTRR
jgi:hypothetical protein